MTEEQDKLFDAVCDLLKYLEMNSKGSLEGEVPRGVEEGLADLESRVAKFKKIFTPKNEIDPLKRFEKLSDREKRLIARWSELGMSTVLMAQALERVNVLFKERKKGKIGTNTRKGIQNRMNKFKNLGSNSKWKKM